MFLDCSWIVLGCSWIVPEIFLNCSLIALGLFLDCSWIVLGLSSDFPWIASGMFLKWSWIVPGLFLDCSWIVLGLLLDCSWLVPGLFLGCSWMNALGLFLDHVFVHLFECSCIFLDRSWIVLECFSIVLDCFRIVLGCSRLLASFAQPESASKSHVLSGSLLIRFTGGAGSRNSCFWKCFSNGFPEGRLEVFFVFLSGFNVSWVVLFCSSFLKIQFFFQKTPSHVFCIQYSVLA